MGRTCSSHTSRGSLTPQQPLAFPTAPTAQLPCLSVKTTCASSRFGSATEKMTVSMALMRNSTCAVRGEGVGGAGTALLGNLLGVPQVCELAVVPF